MDNYQSKEVRQRRRKPYVEGKCVCGAKASLPWKGGKYCVPCWIKIPKQKEKPINWLQHHLNAMHIYCRLCRVMDKKRAKKISEWWEKSIVYKWLYK